MPTDNRKELINRERENICGHSRSCDDKFELFFDSELNYPTPYNYSGKYFRSMKPRMDRTFNLIAGDVKGSHILDVGASPFYLLFRALASGATRASGHYFAHDAHPLREHSAIFSQHGPISLTHSNLEKDPLLLDDDSVDILTACEILEHFDYFPLLLANEIRRVLKPGGLLCITVPNVASAINIGKLIIGRNVYMRYRSDATGRHKHEYTRQQLLAFVSYLGMDLVKDGFLADVGGSKGLYSRFFGLLVQLPFVRRYSPKLFVLARQPTPKPSGSLDRPPAILFDNSLSIEA